MKLYSRTIKYNYKKNYLILLNNPNNIKKIDFIEESQRNIIKQNLKTRNLFYYHNKSNFIVISCPNFKSKETKLLEDSRRSGADIYKLLKENKVHEINVKTYFNDSDFTESVIVSYIEGLFLKNYYFDKYKSQKKRYTLKKVNVNLSKNKTLELQNILDGVNFTKNLINEPLSFLTANQLSKEIKKINSSLNTKIKIFNKKKIEEMKMGGLLAVNKGSFDPPSFNIIEWKPQKHKNKKPVILVGKGVVYDTGGLSLKPTANSMDKMKSDMSGAGVVIGALYSVAKNNLPLHVIGLVPATDNRPGSKAYVPGDIVKMHNGSTVEVLNTDAEGRMLLADALSYAKKYKPELVIDLATLTGSAARAIGIYGAVIMGNTNTNIKKIQKVGYKLNEKTVEFPLWEDYEKEIYSEIADIKNIGGANAGAITAGKFLEHFTDYDWIHIDIAGVSHTTRSHYYYNPGATGFGVRLLYYFLKNYNAKK